MGAIRITPVTSEDRAWMRAVFVRHWNDDYVILADETHVYADEADALVAREPDGEPVGFAALHELDAETAEIAALAVERQGEGIGGALVEAAVEELRARGYVCVRVTTTNDNLDALRLYQRHGFRLCRLRAGVMDRIREHKPQVPEVGEHGIPLRDELDLERDLS